MQHRVTACVHYRWLSMNNVFTFSWLSLTGTHILNRAKSRLPLVMDFCRWNLSSTWTHPCCNNLTTGLWTCPTHPVGHVLVSHSALFCLILLNHLLLLKQLNNWNWYSFFTKSLPEIANLQAHNLSRYGALWARRAAIFSLEPFS